MKRNLFVLMAIGVVLTATGCGKEEEVVVPDTVEEITVSVTTSLKSPVDMTKEELLALTPAEIKEMVETYLPNYRDIYGIDENTEMTDESWMQLRDLIYYQLYGEIVDTVLAEIKEDIDFSNPTEIEGDDGSMLDPDWIYYAPTVEYIESLSTYEFAEYMDGLMEYSGMELSPDDSFTKMSDEVLEELRQKTIEEQCVEWGTVDIPTVNELNEMEVTASENEVTDGAEETDENAEEMEEDENVEE